VEIDGDVYVDGGVLNNIPIEYARRKKKDLLIVVDVNAFIEYEGAKNSAVDLGSSINVLSHSLSLLIEANARNSLTAFPPDILIQLSRESCSMHDFFKVKQQIEYGRQCAENAINEFLKDD
jgi:NTE family protein